LIACVQSSTAFALPDPPMCAVVLPDERPQLTANTPLSDEPVCMPPRPSPRRTERPAWSEPLSAADARSSLDAADAARLEGELGNALLHLRVVEAGVPRIADRIALQRGEVLLDLGQPDAACEAFEMAASSVSRDVAVRGQIGRVRCLLEGGKREGEPKLQELMRRYPELSDRTELQYLLARARAGWGAAHGAATLLRTIDLTEPESEIAALARIELERLRAEGVHVPPFSAVEAVDRAERLLARGPLDAAEVELTKLLQDTRVRGELAARTHLLIARLLRLQGRWDALRQELARARAAGAAPGEATRLAVTQALAAVEPIAAPDAALPLAPTPIAAAAPIDAALGALPSAQVVAPPVSTEAQLAAQAVAQAYERRVRAMRGSKPIGRLPTAQVRGLFELAMSHGDRELVDETLVNLATRKGIVAGMRFDLAMRATGMASESSILTLLETLLPVHQFRVAALYHHARALERAGRSSEAEAEHRRVIEIDRSETRYYAMWSQQWLGKLRAGAPPQIVRAAVAPAEPSELDEGERELAQKVGLAVPATTEAALPIGAHAQRRERASAALRPLVERHGEAYPWLVRALDLIELERFEQAADELSEAYMAYRDARGAPRLRAGLFAVFTGTAPPRRTADFAMRKARLALDASAQAVLREVATSIGDPGIALRFGVFRPDARPRAYAEIVQLAATKYGVDPNLLFAVMRVESIYNRRIVSYAGAVGLMQIMPTTGRRIAIKLGKNDFRVSDLLDPTTNLEMAAWYLASLIDRFEGRLPLAIASYNGGPHNVRVWMRQHHASTPLDAFLERIPFSQTHRYVRRVLTHYAAYRAQQALPMRELSVELPTPRPDTLAF
jgi:soluble lytic murein transglycosylase